VSVTDQEILAAAEHLRRGGIVAAATESYFGLFVDANNREALSALFALKGRDAQKGVALVVPSSEVWLQWVLSPPPLAVALAREFWPGPLTLAVRAAEHVDARLRVDGTVGVRQPGPCTAARLVALFEGALTATSANLAGEPPLVESVAVVERLSARSAALQVLVGSAPGGAPSSVVRVEANHYDVVRPGAIANTALAAAAERWVQSLSTPPPQR
jgi:L-threonylcarbamoyladenylate synthase